jgi:pyruvate/2-oxoglutarate dehydrogenase complex dihydrolipoamide dehydrogenase (E3) component
MVPPIKGIDRISFYTNETIFEIKKLPESIIILGGGPAGIELAQAFNRLGARVTVVEMASRILNREDPELVAILASRLIAEGVLLLTGAKAVMVEGDSGGVRVAFERNGDSIEKIEAQALLVAVGRIPSLKSLDPAGAGVAYTPRGITVNSYLRTNVPNIYACGDIVGPYYFSHVAGYQGIIAGINASLPFGRKQDLGQVLWTIYTDPECAHMGLTEDEARVKFKNRVRVYRVPYSRIDRARIESRDEGLAKYILDGRGMLLGAHIAGYMAGELIHEAQLARQAGIAFSRLQQIMHAYPSYSDIIRQAARDAYIDDIISNPFVILAGKLTGRGKRG